MSTRLEPAIWSRDTGQTDTLFWQVSIDHNMDDGCPMSPTSDITDVRKCPIGQYPLMSAVMVSLSMAAMLDYYDYY